MTQKKSIIIKGIYKKMLIMNIMMNKLAIKLIKNNV